jgi:peptidoglycan/xylan/chitin deacetylase (PgdA/CDA1 family)
MGGSGGSGGSGGMIMSNGCAAGACLNPDCKALGTPAAVGTFAELGFDPKPSYIPQDVIIPTFDDAPDGEIDPATEPGPYKVYGEGRWTAKTLEWLKANNVHADFFINTDNWCGPVSDSDDCLKAIADVLRDQNPANHTVRHIHIGISDRAPDDPGCATDAACEKELQGVEDVVKTLSGGGVRNLTRFRAPYGEPFQVQGTGLDMAKKVVARHAVHIGWDLDDGDSTCDDSRGVPCFTGDQIVQNVVALVGSGPGQGQRHGILLQHSTYPWTYEAAKKLYGKNGYFATHGFRIGTVEDAVCWKYGKHSWELVKQISGKDKSPN